MDNLEKKRIFEYLDQLETDELVRLWKTHDLNEWRETAFEVMEEIIENRTGHNPDQIEIQVPTLEILSVGDSDNKNNRSTNTKTVEKLCNWLDVGSKMFIGLSILVTATQWNRSYSLVHSWFYRSVNINWTTTEIILTIIVLLLNVGLNMIILYLPLRALRFILVTLNQMEKNSRVNQ